MRKRSKNVRQTIFRCTASVRPIYRELFTDILQAVFLPHPLHYVFIKKGFASFILSKNQTIKVNPSLKQPSQRVHRKIPFRTVVQRFTVNLQPSFTKKKNQCSLWFPYEKTLSHFIHLFSERFTRGPLHNGHAP